VHSRQRFRRARPVGARAAAATQAAAARGRAKREDNDSLTVGSRTTVRRLRCRGEDKDSPEFLIFPHSTTPSRRLPRLRRLRRLRRAMSAFSRPSIRRRNAQPEESGWSRSATGAWHVRQMRNRCLGASGSRAHRGTTNKHASRVFKGVRGSSSSRSARGPYTHRTGGTAAQSSPGARCHLLRRLAPLCNVHPSTPLSSCRAVRRPAYADIMRTPRKCLPQRRDQALHDVNL
jgi:hypothetical protein